MFICITGFSSLLNRKVELKRFPLDSLDGIKPQSAIQIDKRISSDGNGPLRITITETKTVNLFKIGNIDVENPQSIDRAQVRTEKI